ncbi:unnamed protein product, partial [Soboliphyme baturini]|uniref:Tick transposon n=1 Tax=Soboliphyme baturini TaxID=241478 RepID=A0A183J663_9BILA
HSIRQENTACEKAKPKVAQQRDGNEKGARVAADSGSHEELHAKACLKGLFVRLFYSAASERLSQCQCHECPGCMFCSNSARTSLLVTILTVKRAGRSDLIESYDSPQLDEVPLHPSRGDDLYESFVWFLW